MSIVIHNVQRNLLPIYVIGADNKKIQDQVNRPSGYHKHQISICLEGSGIYIDENGIEHTIEKGDLFFFSPDIPHEYRPTSEPWRLPYIVFDGTSVTNIIEYLGFGDSMVMKGISSEDFNKISSSFSQIYDTYYSNIDTKTERVSALLYSLLIYISEIPVNATSARATTTVQQLAPALNYISRHIFDDISVNDLADVLNISAGRVSVLFKQAFNMTPVQIIRRYKLEESKRLLSTYPEMKMKDIIDAVGFTSVSYFVTVFKKEYGESPTEFRSNVPSNYTLWQN